MYDLQEHGPLLRLRAWRWLCAIAEIVHDLGLIDNKFNRPEVMAITRSLAGLLRDERRLARQCGLIFDGLYPLPGRDE